MKSLKYSRSPSLIPGMSMRSMELTGRAPVEDLQSYLAARISGLIVPCYRPTSVAALPDKNLFVADGDSDLNVYSCEPGQKVKTVKTGSLRPITALELSGSGRVLAAGMADGRVFLYSSPALSLVKRLEGSAGSGLMRIAFSPDESLLACCAEKVLVVWSLSSGSILARFVNPGHGSICGAVISPDNKHVLARTGESEYRVWNLARKEEVKKIDYVNGFMKTFHDGSICFPSVFVNAGAFFEQVLSDTDQPLPQRMESYIRSNPGGGGMTNHSSAIDMALSRKGDMLAAGGYSVVLYDRAAMRKMGEFGGYAEKAVSIDFSWDGRHLITVDEGV